MPDEPAIGPRLRRTREAKRLTRAAVARAAGLGPEEIERIEDGAADPTLGQLRRLARALGTALGDLLALPPAPLECRVRFLPAAAAGPDPAAGFVPVPVVAGEAAAGNARIVDESVLGWLLLPQEGFGRRAGSLVAVQIYGASMEPELPNGSIAVIDQNDRVLTPEGIYALREADGGCTVKRIEILDEGHIALVPSNRRAFRVEFWRLAPGESLADRLIGRVVWVGFNLAEAGEAAERQPPYGAGGLGRASDLPPPERKKNGEEEPF